MSTNRKRSRYETPTGVHFLPPYHIVLGLAFSTFLFAAHTSLAGVAFAQVSSGDLPTGELHGTATRIGPQGEITALGGIPVSLRANSQKAGPWSTLSDTDGHFDFTGLSAGSYALEVDVRGFRAFTTTIVLQPGESRIRDIRLELATVAVSVDVQGQTEEVTAHSTDPDATLTERHFPALPMAQQKFTEALPLVPGVVRTMDGILTIKGEVGNQGMLLVDSAQMVDPATGAFSVGIPLASVDTLNVFETPYNSQYGGFSGGLSTIETKAPPSQWEYSLMDFVPGIRGKNGQIVGISAETPRAFVGGPLIKDRVNISEAFDYTIKNRPVRGQPWPVNESKLRGFTSFTNMQAILSPKHLLTASVAAFSERTQFADISSLVPQSASSNSGSKGVFATLNATDQFGFGTLNTTFRYTRFDSNAYGQGDQNLLITPEGLAGNAFNQWVRKSHQFEILPMLQLTQKTWYGSHDLKIGADVIHRYYDGANHSKPIEILREDRSLAERIEFHGSGNQHGVGTEGSVFAQNHWVANARLAIDTGFRVTTQSNGRSAAFAPRMGLAYSLGGNHRTVIRAGVGVFYDRVSLLAATFLQNPTRVLTFYTPAGGIASGPMMFQNAYLDYNSSGQVIRTTGNADSSPRNVTWNIEVERKLNLRASLKVSYLQSQTSRLFMVSPLVVASEGTAVLGLGHAGASRYREFQAAFHYRAGRRGDLNIAYLRSQTKGSLNTLSSTYVPFEQAIIRPNVNDYLPADIPNRLLGSAVFTLPHGFTISPVVDLHTGFRYSIVDELNNYVGRPNSQRFPTYFSLDMKLYRDFKLPRFAGRIKDHRFRIGIYSLNLTNHLNPHDVFNNVASPVFGHFVGFQHRVNGMLIDIVK